ncbi:MAG: GNAT family N-acetyltransferase [Nitrospinae bacterium]|nr:GNAT family N-acetyltransferase [Nitrospinota bacterium]
MKQSLQILKKPEEVIRYIDQIMSEADKSRSAFGFNSQIVYEESIQREKTWVAIENNQYIGHLMFGGRPPYFISIFQIFIKRQDRGKGFGKALLAELQNHAEKQWCLSLKAKVAEDLTTAIDFYQGQGFSAVSKRKKSKTTGREIYVFVKKLNTPSLIFDETLSLRNISTKPGGILAENYVIDLNIFISLMKNRDYEEVISGIIKAALCGEFNVYVTPEFEVELNRYAIEDDHLLSLAKKAFPVLGKYNDTSLLTKESELRQIVFPGRKMDRKKSRQDDSDLRHLAYCVLSGIEGFVTSEKVILMAGNKLDESYGLKIYSPRDFQVEVLPDNGFYSLDVPIETNKGSLVIIDSPGKAEINNFLKGLADCSGEVRKVLGIRASRGLFEQKAVKENDSLCGIYTIMTRGLKQDILEGYFIASEKDFSGNSLAFEHILEHFLRAIQKFKPRQISFHILEGQVFLEKIILEQGFIRHDNPLSGIWEYIKIPAPLLITKGNWAFFRDTLKRITGIDAPVVMPTSKKDNEGIPIIDLVENQKINKVPVFEIETLLSPSVLLFSNRKGIVLPIKPGFTQSLLSRPYDSLPFPLTQEAYLLLEKAYFRSPRGVGMFEKGLPIIFYESGGGRGAIGCARITSSEVCGVENALKIYRRNGVLSKEQLWKMANKNGKVLVVTFDNFKEFTTPISLKRLHGIGCGKANFVGPELVSPKRLRKVLHEGLGVPDRDVILSVHPSYVSKILSGKKTVELRKKPFPIPEGSRVWIYSTNPVSSISSIAIVKDVFKGSLSDIWKRYKNKCGISEKIYGEYFSGFHEGYAITLENARPLRKKIKLQEIRKWAKNFNPPQYYRFLDHDSKLFSNLIKLIE